MLLAPVSSSTSVNAELSLSLAPRNLSATDCTFCSMSVRPDPEPDGGALASEELPLPLPLPPLSSPDLSETLEPATDNSPDSPLLVPSTLSD